MKDSVVVGHKTTITKQQQQQWRSRKKKKKKKVTLVEGAFLCFARIAHEGGRKWNNGSPFVAAAVAVADPEKKSPDDCFVLVVPYDPNNDCGQAPLSNKEFLSRVPVHE